MKILNRYLLGQIAGGLVLAAAIIVPLFSFLDLIDQLDDVGRGTYTARDAFQYMLLMMPRRFIELAPFIALLGNVAALGRLAIGGELISMRGAGMSPGRIAFASIQVGLALIAIIVAVDQYLASPMQQRAIALRAAAMEQSAELGRDLGIWSRDETEILRIGRMTGARDASDVEILRLGADGFLSEHVHAVRAEIRSGDEWLLHDVTRRIFHEDRVEKVRLPALTWAPFLRPDQLSTLLKPAESLSPAELFEYVRYLRTTGQESDAYALALWRKIGGGVTALAMMLLSVPFVFGSLRAGLGQRIVLAAVAGIAIYLLDQIVGNAGLLLDMNPALIALAPGVILLAGGQYWLRRVA